MCGWFVLLTVNEHVGMYIFRKVGVVSVSVLMLVCGCMCANIYAAVCMSMCGRVYELVWA